MIYWIYPIEVSDMPLTKHPVSAKAEAGFFHEKNDFILISQIAKETRIARSI